MSRFVYLQPNFKEDCLAFEDTNVLFVLLSPFQDELSEDVRAVHVVFQQAVYVRYYTSLRLMRAFNLQYNVATQVRLASLHSIT